MLNAFVSIGLPKHDYGLHSPRTGGASATANAWVADRLFKRHGRCKSDKVKDDFIKDDIQPLFSVSLIVLKYFNFLFPVLLVRTRLVLTHPNYGCFLHGNVSHSFERGSELEHKWIYHRLRNLLCGPGCCMVCRYNCFISRELVYVLRCFHSYSFASYERVCTLKIKYPISEGCQFFILIFKKSMQKSQCIYCIISRLLAVFWAFQSFFNFAVSFSYSYFNLRCRIKASRVRDKTDYRQPHPLETPTFLSSKWLAIGDLRCMDEALLILLIIIH